MCAEYLKFGEPPPTIGGDYEREVVKKLCKELSKKYLILGNPSLPTRSSYFYEYDIIILSPFLCDIIEVKRIYPEVRVYDDWLESTGDFRIPQVFSILANKKRVLENKLRSNPFEWENSPNIDYRIIVGPDETEIKFIFKLHKDNKKVLNFSQAIKYYQEAEQNLSTKYQVASDNFERICQVWKRYAMKTNFYNPERHKLGRYIIRKRINTDNTSPEYHAIDEPPCKIDVHLKEYPFDMFATPSEIEQYLKSITLGMQTLRRLRHQYIRCVTGHFRTGYSFVQISDWFEGSFLENMWKKVQELRLVDKLAIMTKITQALTFCHENGVFHRNICAANILIKKNFDDIKITGFELAKDLERTMTASTAIMGQRDPRIIPPEELSNKKYDNYRLSDIYQTGLLFYRIIENGVWPFENVLDYITKNCDIRNFTCHSNENAFKETKKIILNMLNIKPQQRPDLMDRIEKTLIKIIESQN